MVSSAKRSLRVGIVAGEKSGDLLASDLMQTLSTRLAAQDIHVDFEGIAGHEMIAQGCKVLYPLERLSVMGFTEVLSRLFELIGARKRVAQHFLDNPPDLFIGVDAPDFTLALEEKLKSAGITTVHYVSPSVWAWKRKRIFKIKRAADLLLTLLPFEADCYRETQQRLAFVGHPLADQLPANLNQMRIKQLREPLAPAEKLVAIMPGSRGSEVRALLGPFIDTARWLVTRHPDLQFVIPAATEKLRDEIDAVLKAQPDLPIGVQLGGSREVMAAADAVLIASGTATLEAALIGTPMVVSYKVSALSYAIYSRLVKVDYVALPNLLAAQEVAPECLQDRAVPEVMGPLMERALFDEAYRTITTQNYQRIGDQLRCQASERATDAVLALLKDRDAL